MPKDDEVRLRHMLEAAREAVSFARGRDRGDLDTDRQLVLSLVKDIEIVGEAAAQVTEAVRAQVPDIPWQVHPGRISRQHRSPRARLPQDRHPPGVRV